MYIPEIFNYFLGEDGSTDKSNQAVYLDFP